MSNMSYCRFENTARDLQDCVDAINEGETTDLSNHEISGLADILYLAADIIDNEEYIKEIINKQ